MSKEENKIVIEIEYDPSKLEIAHNIKQKNEQYHNIMAQHWIELLTNVELELIAELGFEIAYVLATQYQNDIDTKYSKFKKR